MKLKYENGVIVAYPEESDIELMRQFVKDHPRPELSWNDFIKLIRTAVCREKEEERK